MDGSNSILQAAIDRADERILALGKDFVVLEAMYHSSCRRDYCLSAPLRIEGDTEQKSKKLADEAFKCTCTFIVNEVVSKKCPMMIRNIYSLYMEKIARQGGDKDTIITFDWFLQKLKDYFQNCIIDKMSNKQDSFYLSKLPHRC